MMTEHGDRPVFEEYLISQGKSFEKEFDEKNLEAWWEYFKNKCDLGTFADAFYNFIQAQRDQFFLIVRFPRKIDVEEQINKILSDKGSQIKFYKAPIITQEDLKKMYAGRDERWKKIEKEAKETFMEIQKKFPGDPRRQYIEIKKEMIRLRMEQNQKGKDCKACGGLKWIPGVDEFGYEFVTECECRRRERNAKSKN